MDLRLLLCGVFFDPPQPRRAQAEAPLVFFSVDARLSLSGRAMDLPWPGVSGDLLSQLKDSFATPKQLHYGFDDEEGAAQLVGSLMKGWSQANIKTSAELLHRWHLKGAGTMNSAKRVARDRMSESLLGQHVVAAGAISEAFERLANSNPLSLLPAIERARKAREHSIDPATRAAAERDAKAKYALLLFNFLVEAKAPIVTILQGVSEPEEACVRIFGTRKSKTLRNRYHSWNKFSRWLETSKGRRWPIGLQDLLDYATEAVKEGAGKTTLEAFAASLAVLEQVGKFDENEMLSRDTTWIAFSKNVTAELVEKGPTLHQAAQPTVAMALSLELYLGDGERPKYARAIAFVALAMLWGSMRADDVQCMRPESMRLTIEGFSCKLWKTKTTGPDRRVNMIQVFISRKVGFSGMDWLRTGMSLWGEIDTQRDFLVLQAAEDWESCTSKGVDASTVGLYLRKVFKELCTPRWHEGQWRQNTDRLLLPGECALHFAGHSARNFLTSVAAAIGVPEGDRDYLGRWKVGGGGSADYTRFPPLFFQNLQGPLLVPDEPEEVTAADFDAVCKDCKVRIRLMTNEVLQPSMANDAEMRERVNSVDADLQYVLQEAGSRAAAATDFGIPNDTPAGRQQTAAIVAAWEIAKEISSKEIELRAQARALNQPRVLQTQERQAMLRAVSAAYGKLNEAEAPSAEYLALKAEETEQNEPTAAQLDTITSKRDSQTASIQSSVDPAGHLRITKTKQKVEMPQNSEAYRRVIKVEEYAWLAMQARYKSKSWLQELTMADFTSFVDFVLGERVAGLRLEQTTGYDHNNNAQFRPPWGIVLRYEYRMHKEAFRLVNEDGLTLKAALLAVTKDTEMKEVHFVTPLTLTAFPMPSKWTRRTDKGDKGGKGDPKGGRKGKENKGRAQGQWHTVTAQDWPLDLCSYVSHSVLSPVLRTGGAAGYPAAVKTSSTPDVGAGCPDSPEAHLHAAEKFASELLAGGSTLQAKDLERVYDLLPKETSPRDPDGRTPSSFSSGAYNKGGVTGLRKAIQDFPKATRCLTHFVRTVRPQHVFSTVSLYDNVCTSLHRDSRNSPIDNLVLPLTKFSGGEVWLKDEKGTVPQSLDDCEVMGTAFAIPADGLAFNAKQTLHCTMPWTGRRLVLVAFTVARLEVLKPGDTRLLTSAGFNLPAMAAEQCSQSSCVGSSDDDHPSPSASSGEHATTQDDSFKPERRGNFGGPLLLEWDGQVAPMTDGYGLCSPTRWLPASRGATLSHQAKDMSRRLHELVRAFVVKQVPDCQHLCLRLAAGHVTSSPFDDGSLQRLREEWASIVCNIEGVQHEGLLEVSPPQPFYLRLLACTARLLEDPDWQILTEGDECFERGVPLGYDEVIPRVPQVFERKVKWRKLDESTFEAIKDNYSSAKLTVQELEQKFREEEKAGRMYPTTFATLAAEHGADRVRVAAMGAVAKPDGTVRPLHDGTHGVRVNNGIHLVNQTATPGPAEVAHIVSSAKRSREAAFGISADVTAAHRLVKHRRKDHPLMACKADSSSSVLWVNTVGTFGLSVASFWWSRLFGIVGRTVSRALLQEWFYQLCCVDDMHGVFTGRQKFRNLVMWFVLYLALGTPFSFKKFKGGFKVPFVGYELDYSTWKVGMSDARGAWIISWIKTVILTLLYLERTVLDIECVADTDNQGNS
ncbi:unnamed protein product, partial [Symbiodinium microadriaticum]